MSSHLISGHYEIVIATYRSDWRYAKANRGQWRCHLRNRRVSDCSNRPLKSWCSAKIELKYRIKTVHFTDSISDDKNDWSWDNDSDTVGCHGHFGKRSGCRSISTEMEETGFHRQIRFIPLFFPRLILTHLLYFYCRHAKFPPHKTNNRTTHATTMATWNVCPVGTHTDHICLLALYSTLRLSGWQGDLCDVPICRKGCDPMQGYCKRPGECRCNLGFYGDKCERCIPLPGCQHGTCNVSFECICNKGWDGLFCSERESIHFCVPIELKNDSIHFIDSNLPWWLSSNAWLLWNAWWMSMSPRLGRTHMQGVPSSARLPARFVHKTTRMQMPCRVDRHSVSHS